MTVELEELKRLAQEAQENRDLILGVHWQMATNPLAVLALIERVERAEKDAEKYKAGVLVERALGHEMKQRWGEEAEKRILLGARVTALEALARKGLEAHHKGSGCPAAQHVDSPAECSHAACRKWAAALEAK